jgi:N-methylhydantoinase A/oxoprolinase/acetone carboxylase beta subunit
MAWQIGVDVGGTFTDLLALDPERGVFRVAKVPSTPEDQSVGFIAGLSVLEPISPRSPRWFTAPRSPPMPCSNARERAAG